MFHDFKYPAILAASNRAAWQIDDVIGPGAALDFARPFMPEILARTADLDMLSDEERLTLNHIRAHEYLSLFGLVEEFILPFVLDHVRADLPEPTTCGSARCCNSRRKRPSISSCSSASTQAFTAGFGTRCEMIGPPEAVAKVVLATNR